MNSVAQKIENSMSSRFPRNPDTLIAAQQIEHIIEVGLQLVLLSRQGLTSRR